MVSSCSCGFITHPFTVMNNDITELKQSKTKVHSCLMYSVFMKLWFVYKLWFYIFITRHNPGDYPDKASHSHMQACNIIVILRTTFSSASIFFAFWFKFLWSMPIWVKLPPPPRPEAREGITTDVKNKKNCYSTEHTNIKSSFNAGINKVMRL